MLKRDYILALIENFFNALARLIEQRKSGKTEDSLALIEKCYASLHLDKEQRLNADLELLAERLNSDEKPALLFLEILAGLLMEEYYVTAGNEKKLLSRALELYQYVDLRDRTFSFERREKIEWIRSMLDNEQYGKED